MTKTGIRFGYFYCKPLIKYPTFASFIGLTGLSFENEKTTDKTCSKQ